VIEPRLSGRDRSIRDKRTHQDPLTAVDHDRGMAGSLGDVAGRGRRVVGRFLEGVEAPVERLLELEADPAV
jgi:hypothetical protein